MLKVMSKPGECMRSWDKPGGDLLTASAASGVKRARARFRLLRGTGEPVVLESPWSTRGGGSSSSGRNRKRQSTRPGHGGGPSRSSDEAAVNDKSGPWPACLSFSVLLWEILSAPAPKPERKPRSDKGTHKKPAPDLGGTLSRDQALETRRLMQAWADALDVALTAIAARNRAEDELQRYLDEITAK